MTCTFQKREPVVKQSSIKEEPDVKKKSRLSITKKSSVLANCKTFRRISDYVFDEIDSDKSGGVDELELYTGLLLFHVYLSSYLGPAAAKPASRLKVQEVFRMMDIDNNGVLDQDEFARALAILSSHLISRIVSVLCLTIFLVPILTQHLLKYTSMISSFLITFISNLEIVHHILSYANCIDVDSSNNEELSMNVILISCVESFLNSSKALIVLFLSIETFITYLIHQYFGFGKAVPYVLTKLVLAKNYFFTVLPVSAITAAPRAIISLMLGYVIIPKVIITFDKKFDAIASRVSLKHKEGYEGSKHD